MTKQAQRVIALIFFFLTFLGVFAFPAYATDFRPAAELYNVIPNPATSGTEVTLYGNYLGYDWGSVVVVGEPCQIIDWQESAISFRLPQRSLTGQFQVFVYKPGDSFGPSIALNILPVENPVIYTTSQSLVQNPSGPVNQICIEGRGFGATLGTVNIINGPACEVKSWDNNCIRVNAPTGLRGLDFNLLVKTSTGKTARTTIAIFPPLSTCPGLGGFWPENIESYSPDAEVMLWGTGLGTATGVFINDQPCTILYPIFYNNLKFKVPANLPAAQNYVLKVNFEYSASLSRPININIPQMYIETAELQMQEGNASSGMITITGSGFGPCPGSVALSLDGNNFYSFPVNGEGNWTDSCIKAEIQLNSGQLYAGDYILKVSNFSGQEKATTLTVPMPPLDMDPIVIPNVVMSGAEDGKFRYKVYTFSTAPARNVFRIIETKVI